MSWRAIVATVSAAAALHAAPFAAAPPAGFAKAVAADCHHYSVSARIRPFLFWISSDDVGDAVVVKRSESQAVRYSLLIGSDPDRAPRRINRWGYIDEERRGDEAFLLGLMTESDEDSVEEAESAIQKRAGQRTFNIIRSTVVGREARSTVTSIAAPADYSYRNVDAVLALARRDSHEGETRMKQLPPGTRPGFLVTLAEVIHGQVTQWQTQHRVTASDPVTYVYHGHLYQLVTSSTRALAIVRVGTAMYEHAISSRFEIRNTDDGTLTPFSMTFAAEGSLAETLLAASYRPRWWLEVQLALDDTTAGPAVTGGLNP